MVLFIRTIVMGSFTLAFGLASIFTYLFVVPAVILKEKWQLIRLGKKSET